MGSHPVNLAIRFLLEVSALLAMGVWGWKQNEGGFRIAIALGTPLIAAVLWGTLAVAGDPSRSGAAPVPIPGLLRLALELTFFAFATWTMYEIGAAKMSALFGVVVVVHYLVSFDRVLWLLAR